MKDSCWVIKVTYLKLGKLEKIPKLFNNPEDKQMYQMVLDILEREV